MAGRGSEKPGEEICCGGLGVGGNYLWHLVIVVIFMKLRGAKSLRGRRGFKVIISDKGGTSFVGVDPSRHHGSE